MKIHAVFANRKHDPEEIELVTAWDEYSVDANPEGFADDVAKSLASWGDDLLRHVAVEIDVDYLPIYKALAQSLEVKGSLTIPSERTTEER